jgi:hypothetical protein
VGRQARQPSFLGQLRRSVRNLHRDDPARLEELGKLG